MYFDDFILNGSPNGEVSERLAQVQFDAGIFRPFVVPGNRHVLVSIRNGFDEKGQPRFVTHRANDLREAGIPVPMVTHATALRLDDWRQMDQAVITVARQRLRAWSDLAATSVYSLNGMTKMTLEHETMSDSGEAFVDMDGMSEGRGDEPLFQVEGLPLPITQSGFFFSERRLAVSRNSGQGIDTLQAENASRKVSESIEAMTIGTATALQYGGPASRFGRTPKVYGYTNFTARNTKTDLTTPDGTNGPAVLTDLLEMIEIANGDGFFGPFMLYHSTPYSVWMNNLFSTTEPSAGTLRSRLMQVEGIDDIRRLDYLTSGYQLVLVQRSSNVARAVVGMNINTIMWESMGGLRKNFKVMGIMVPQLRADYDGRCGIVHGTTS